MPSKAEGSVEVCGHKFNVNPIRVVVSMSFSATLSCLGDSMEKADLGSTEVRIFQRL